MVELPPRPRPPSAPSPDPDLGLAISARTLANGLHVVVVRDPTATDVQVTMRYQVGASSDGASPGIAHLVEHLMFQQPLDGRPVFSHLEDIATYFNAATTFDATTYVARAPASGLAKLLSIEALRIEQRCGTLTEDAFTHEREVVVHEIQQRDVSAEIYSALYRAVFPDGHPYQRSVGGSVDTVRAITREQACAFADTYYAPNNAVLVVSGKLASTDLEAALADVAAHVTRRVAATPTPVAPPPARAQHVEIATPIDHDVLVVAWPLPRDPELQAQVRAIAAALPNLVEDNIKGSAMAVELGDRSGPMLGIASVTGDGETFKQVIDGTRRAVERLPRVFEDTQPDNVDEVLFDRIKQSAVYSLYSALEDGGDRDERLASYVAEGRDPYDAMMRDIAAVSDLTREEAADLAARYLAARTPMVVTLKASTLKKRGDKITLHAPIHDLGRRRSPIDPALASRPEPAPLATAPLVARTRTLPNGLKIVLLPVTAVPTFDARLIFAAGTADEPAGERGVAMFAAHTLTWNLRHFKDILAFARAGGMRNADVDTDRTTFSVQGLDTNLDVVLAGLRRWVRDGVYDDSAQTFASAMQSVARRVDDQGALTDAWRAALFGPQHPYVEAGLVRHANPAITLEEAAAFRGAYFTPDNATLVISGHFDADLANRWIDYLFADWQGRAAGHRYVPAMPRPATVAKADETTLVQVKLAIPVAAGARAQHLVIAEMLSDIAHDVRYQLGATYTFGAQLAETRQASYLVVGGWVDAPSTTAAVELVRDRIAELQRDHDAAARAFVVARAHVAARLRARVGSAAALAERIENDVELARDPLSDLNLASIVEGLTLPDMVVVLHELDLTRATMLMDGPQGDVGAAAKALGRDATYLASSPPAAATSAPGMSALDYKGAEQHVRRTELEPALTDRPMPRMMVAVTANADTAAVDDGGSTYTGYSIAAEIGYRYGWTNAIGARLEVGRLSLGVTDAHGGAATQTLFPVDALALWHLGGTGRTWGQVMLGMHFEHFGGETMSTAWRSEPIYGLEGGIDLVRHRLHRVGVSLRWEAAPQGSFSYSSFSVGLAYRR